MSASTAHIPSKLSRAEPIHDHTSSGHASSGRSGRSGRQPQSTPSPRAHGEQRQDTIAAAHSPTEPYAVRVAALRPLADDGYANGAHLPTYTGTDVNRHMPGYNQGQSGAARGAASASSYSESSSASSASTSGTPPDYAASSGRERVAAKGSRHSSTRNETGSSRSDAGSREVRRHDSGRRERSRSSRSESSRRESSRTDGSSSKSRQHDRLPRRSSSRSSSRTRTREIAPDTIPQPRSRQHAPTYTAHQGGQAFAAHGALAQTAHAAHNMPNTRPNHMPQHATAAAEAAAAAALAAASVGRPHHQVHRGHSMNGEEQDLEYLENQTLTHRRMPQGPDASMELFHAEGFRLGRPGEFEGEHGFEHVDHPPRVPDLNLPFSAPDLSYSRTHRYTVNVLNPYESARNGVPGPWLRFTDDEDAHLAFEVHGGLNHARDAQSAYPGHQQSMASVVDVGTNTVLLKLHGRSVQDDSDQSGVQPRSPGMPSYAMRSYAASDASSNNTSTSYNRKFVITVANEWNEILMTVQIPHIQSQVSPASARAALANVHSQVSHELDHMAYFGRSRAMSGPAAPAGVQYSPSYDSHRGTSSAHYAESGNAYPGPRASRLHAQAVASSAVSPGYRSAHGMSYDDDLAYAQRVREADEASGLRPDETGRIPYATGYDASAGAHHSRSEWTNAPHAPFNGTADDLTQGMAGMRIGRSQHTASAGYENHGRLNNTQGQTVAAGIEALYGSPDAMHAAAPTSPILKLIPTSDGAQQLLLNDGGKELAVVSHSQAHTGLRGPAYGLTLHPGADVTLAVAMVAAEMWIMSETGPY